MTSNTRNPDQPGRLLLVDDNPTNLSLLTRIFQPLGNIVTTDNTYECIQMAKDLGPDLIMLDKDRGIIDGVKTSAHLKDNLRTARIPVVYLSQEKLTKKTASDQICIAIPMDALTLRQQVEGILDV